MLTMAELFTSVLQHTPWGDLVLRAVDDFTDVEAFGDGSQWPVPSAVRVQQPARSVELTLQDRVPCVVRIIGAVIM